MREEVCAACVELQSDFTRSLLEDLGERVPLGEAVEVIRALVVTRHPKRVEFLKSYWNRVDREEFRDKLYFLILEKDPEIREFMTEVVADEDARDRTFVDVSRTPIYEFPSGQLARLRGAIEVSEGERG